MAQGRRLGDRLGDLKLLALVLLGPVALLALAGWMFLDNGHALAKKHALDTGSVERVAARMSTFQDHHHNRRGHRRGPNAWDMWHATFVTVADDERIGVGDFEMRGDSDVLHAWDGEQVTALVWHGQVIGVELPDGTVARGLDVGWGAVAARWTLGLVFVGGALLVMGLFWGLGRIVTAVGGVVLGVGLLGFFNLEWHWVGYALDAVVLIGGAWYVVQRARGPARAASRQNAAP